MGRILQLQLRGAALHILQYLVRHAFIDWGSRSAGSLPEGIVPVDTPREHCVQMSSLQVNNSMLNEMLVPALQHGSPPAEGEGLSLCLLLTLA